MLTLVCLGSLFLFSATGSAAAQQRIRLTPGLVITSSVVVEPGTYRIPADSTGAIVIRGNSITVDFAGAVLVGWADVTAPNAFTGTGIRIVGSDNVTLMNAVVKGYKVAVHATDSDDLHIDGGDFSYNYRQRLKSTIEREHLDDWMSYHNNEVDEWLRFGAAIYLRRCERPRVEGIRVTGGQNGVMLTEVNDGVIVNNDIVFNSAIGVGLYRSSRNRIEHNRLDWNVRGYSHGVYNRGQDSAAILLYEQSSNNIIAYNSATHSGDGLFLWAGQTTMDTGDGGCNDNLILGNDFSFAPTNGIEVTFSRNTIIRNRMEGCWHGIWGGYSYDTVIRANQFVDNDEHIAIEHGQRIDITANNFVGGNVGVRAWERGSQPADWGYSQNRDVASRGFDISLNVFDGVKTPLDVTNTDSVADVDNLVYTGATETATEESAERREQFGDPGDARYPRDPRNGRRFILVDEWGPHDFLSPILWPRSDRTAKVQRFEILGPPGEWRVVSTTGVDSVSAHTGTVPDSITVWRSDASVVDMNIALEYVGGEVTDRFGVVTSAGEPFGFEYEYFFVPIRWQTDFFEYDESTDPLTQPDAFGRLIEGETAHTVETEALAFQWYGSPAPGVGADHFATVSEGTLEVPPGTYSLELTSDDGVRVWVDGQLVHDDWTYHAPRLAEVEVELGGRHEIRIEHFEIDGYATLVLALRGPAAFTPNDVVPTPEQVAYQKMEYIGFVHFGINTFTDREWGYGDESPDLFDPPLFDADQWASVAAEVGMKELILTAKHHDGFALWPSAHTVHSVASSSWRGGSGDVVREFVDAARAHGVKVGLYLSPWDRNHAEYGTSAYIDYYRDQLTELLTNYGEVNEVWFDGANGGDGYYGGAREERRIDRATYYDWDTTWGLVKSLQPHTLIFSDAGPDIRWMGNEFGYAGETNWSTINASGIVVGAADEDYLNTGDPDGADWVVPLCNTSIRPGWFYHASEDDSVKSVDELLEVYYRSVGRNCVLLLNVPPDQRGLFHENDIAALREFRRVLDETFSTNLLAGADVESDSRWSRQYEADNVVDGDADSFWAASHDARSGELTFRLDEEVTFDVVMLQEPIRYGQRVSSFRVEVEEEGEWREIGRGTTIGYKRLLRIAPVTADRIRVVIEAANNAPALAEVGLYSRRGFAASE